MRLREFNSKPSVHLFEINMRPSNLERLAKNMSGVRVGMEFEMCVPGAGFEDSEDFDSEPDNTEESASSFSKIEDFFRGENSTYSVRRLISRLQDEYNDWVTNRIDTDWGRDKEEIVSDYLILNDIEGANDMAGDELEELVDKVLDGGPYRRLFEEIYEDFVETQRDNDEYGQSEFLSDNGYDTMWDVFRAYDNIISNWPYYTEPESYKSLMDGDEVADSFSRSVGVNAPYSSSRYQNVSPDKWRVEPDGSIKPDDPNDAGLEFVTPKGGLPLDEMLDKMELVKKWADWMGCTTNARTGLHINVSIPNFNSSTVDYVKLVLLLGDNYILDVFNRRGYSYAKSSFDYIARRIESDPSIVTKMFEKMRGELDQFASQLITVKNPERTFSVNLKDDYVEFRSPGNIWLTDKFWKQVKPTMLRFIVALDAACDPKKYREEYLKKLYKLLNASNTKSEDITQLFAKYVAGEMPRSALVSFVRQAQTRRNVVRGVASGQKYWWKVELPGFSYGIEVVGKDAEEAKQRALDSTPDWVRQGVTAGRLRATPVRPYDLDTQRNELAPSNEAEILYEIFGIDNPNEIIGMFYSSPAPDVRRAKFRQYLSNIGITSLGGYGYRQVTS